MNLPHRERRESFQPSLIFRHPHCCPPRLDAFSILGPCFPFNPFLSSSKVVLAVLTSRFQKSALRRLLVQRKVFRLLLRIVSLSIGYPEPRYLLQLLQRLSFSLASPSSSFVPHLREQPSLRVSLAATGTSLVFTILTNPRIGTQNIRSVARHGTSNLPAIFRFASSFFEEQAAQYLIKQDGGATARGRAGSPRAAASRGRGQDGQVDHAAPARGPPGEPGQALLLPSGRSSVLFVVLRWRTLSNGDGGAAVDRATVSTATCTTRGPSRSSSRRARVPSRALRRTRCVVFGASGLKVTDADCE